MSKILSLVFKFSIIDFSYFLKFAIFFFLRSRLADGSDEGITQFRLHHETASPTTTAAAVSINGFGGGGGKVSCGSASSLYSKSASNSSKQVHTICQEYIFCISIVPPPPLSSFSPYALIFHSFLSSNVNAHCRRIIWTVF